ncbi:alpha/beta hydrolase [Campylobacter sp. CCUG 57310]|uniref:alpha/beta hydrolase n=1 Tax=Campylobacter sp. CCUG 57310 TaxID=2517362 RepID=UPI00156495B1|nr:alpha/beta fold hydrolase [Campylobacter sp. CCUG 57310]QKF91833.1 alpha/beta hydrolase family protein [Campylobacter sp. CCUG 57310]
MGKTVLYLSSVFFLFYLVVLALLYVFQEKLLFVPTKLASDYKFEFGGKFEEINLNVEGATLNGLHFYAHDPKGAVLFLHGNAGSLKGWGGFGKFYTDLGYDFYVFDYRGYGKSSGEISNQNELYNDSYEMMKRVLEDFDIGKIRLVGYSLGSGLAANIASKFDVRELVLVAPYFKFDELASSKVFFVPKFIVKYKIPTVSFLKEAKNTNISIIHGKFDDLIEVLNSHKLAKILKPTDKFYEIDAGHNDILYNAEFEQILEGILSK